MKRLAIATTLALAGCFSSGPTSSTYSGGQAPRSDGVLREAERDLGCPIAQLRVVTETGRRFLNETKFRFVVEGCGERAGYVEECELVGSPAPAGWTTIDGSLACRWIIVTRLRVAPAAASPPPAAPAAL